MKYMKMTIILFAITVSTFCCRSGGEIAKNKDSNETYINYLSSVINDTTFFEIPELKIVDSSIYPVLDSAILWSENCGYFDPKIKNLYSFLFEARLDSSSDFLYTINTHLSPSYAIGLNLVKAGIFKKIENIGIFYYRHFLFVIPMANYGDQKELEYFPFVMQGGNKLKIRAPKFQNEKKYSSYITFSKRNFKYKIIENEICGVEILIR